MEKDANANFYFKAQGDSIGIQGRKGPGISFPLHKCKRGLYDEAHDVVPFPELTCSQEQEQAHTARVLEGQQEGMGDGSNFHGLVP